MRCRPPHACIHLEKFMYPLALVSGAPHKAYIFRFNTPTINTFPASGTHTCLILRGYPPPSSHTFLEKSEGVNPPLMFIHYQKCMIHPPCSWTSWGRGCSAAVCGTLLENSTRHYSRRNRTYVHANQPRLSPSRRLSEKQRRLGHTYIHHRLLVLLTYPCVDHVGLVGWMVYWDLIRIHPIPHSC